MDISNYSIFLTLIAFSTITIAECNSDRLSHDIKHLVNARPDKYTNGYYDTRRTALSLENVILCNEEKFSDLDVHVLHVVEWTGHDCSEWVARPGTKKRIYKNKACFVHDNGMPKIQAGRSHYYLNSINLSIYFDNNEFVRAEIEEK